MTVFQRNEDVIKRKICNRVVTGEDLLSPSNPMERRLKYVNI